MSIDRRNDSRIVSRRSFLTSCGVALGGCLIAPRAALADPTPEAPEYPVRITDVTSAVEGDGLCLRLLGRETDGPLYRFNGSGRLFWELADGRHDVACIHREIARHLGVPVEEVAVGMKGFLAGVTSQGLIYWRTTPLPPPVEP